MAWPDARYETAVRDGEWGYPKMNAIQDWLVRPSGLVVADFGEVDDARSGVQPARHTAVVFSFPSPFEDLGGPYADGGPSRRGLLLVQARYTAEAWTPLQRPGQYARADGAEVAVFVDGVDSGVSWSPRTTAGPATEDRTCVVSFDGPGEVSLRYRNNTTRSGATAAFWSRSLRVLRYYF